MCGSVSRDVTPNVAKNSLYIRNNTHSTSTLEDIYLDYSINHNITPVPSHLMIFSHVRAIYANNYVTSYTLLNPRIILKRLIVLALLGFRRILFPTIPIFARILHHILALITDIDMVDVLEQLERNT